jgi:hypothetical protein
MKKSKETKKGKKKNESKKKVKNIKTYKKDKYDFPFEFRRLLDIDRILKSTKNKNKLKVTLLHNKKGNSVYATKKIKENEVIAYYKMRIFDQNHYDSPTNFVYAFSIYGGAGNQYKTLIGDIDKESIPDPINNIPFWGLFVNEPSGAQDINSRVDIDHEYNFTKFGRKRAKCGMYFIYKIIATRNIEPNEEITIYYGDEYERDYHLSVTE